MRKGGGYAMAAYLLDRDGADEVLMTYLRGSVSLAIKYDDRATAIAWGGQILAALRDYAGRFESRPPLAAVKAIRDISRRLSRYVDGMDLEGGGRNG